jgi:spore coat polysaccharide biosynthesis protein SpsF
MTAARPRIVAIVQARMNSTRLPGKVLRLIAGEPLLWHVVHRLRSCRTVADIAVATSTDSADDVVADFCGKQGITCIRGSQQNVLARFALAAAKTRADIVVRVTGDAPFVDPGFIDHFVTALIEQDGDYVKLAPGVRCAHDGVDPLTRRALDRLVKEVPKDPVAREHVTGYFKLHPDFARAALAPAYPPLDHDEARLSVDTPDDLAFAEAAYQRLGAKPGEASLPDLLNLLERDPSLRAINAHVRQKTLRQKGGLALIRCDGGHSLGYGHIRRCLMVARALRDSQGFGVVFVLDGDEGAAAKLRGADFEALMLPQSGGSDVLASLVKKRKPSLLVADARRRLTRAELAGVAAKLRAIAVLDDISDRRFAATHAYYAPLPQVAELSWKGSSCKVRIGWEWSLLGFDPAHYRRQANQPGRPELIVTMGGSDPKDFTRLALKAVAQMTTPVRARFVIGPDFAGASALAHEIEAAGFEALHDVADLAAEFARADLALISFGVTAYEMAALGVPSLYLALTEDHAKSASAFCRAGMGDIAFPDADRIAAALNGLIADKDRRHAMSDAGRTLIDGQGAMRIAAELAAVSAP